MRIDLCHLCHPVHAVVHDTQQVTGDAQMAHTALGSHQVGSTRRNQCIAVSDHDWACARSVCQDSMTPPHTHLYAPPAYAVVLLPLSCVCGTSMHPTRILSTVLRVAVCVFVLWFTPPFQATWRLQPACNLQGTPHRRLPRALETHWTFTASHK